MNVAIVQAHLEWENVPVNLKLFNKRIAAIEGANIIVLPEMFASGFTMKGKERVAPFYEAVYQCMQEWAREKDALIDLKKPTLEYPGEQSYIEAYSDFFDKIIE